MRLLPVDQEIRHQFAIFLVRVGKENDALELLGDLKSFDNLSSALLLARLLNERGETDDYESAIRVLKPALSRLESLSPDDMFNAAEILGDIYVTQGKTESAHQFLDKNDRLFSESAIETLRANLSHRAKDPQTARTHATRAASAMEETTPDRVGYFLADLLAELGEFETALKVLKPIVTPGAFKAVVHRAVDCACRTEDYQFIFDFCGQLRRAGTSTPFTLEAEIAALEQHSDFVGSVAIIDEYLQHPKDVEFAKSLRVRKSLAGLRLDRHEWIETNIEMLPSPQSVLPEFGCVVARMLSRAGQFEAAAKYAYELFRSHSDVAEVHKCIGMLFGIGDGAQFRFPDPQIVGPGSAVRFRIEGSETEQWLVIEEEYTPRSTLQEVAPNTDLATELMGKSVGEDFYYRRNPIQDLKATITGLAHKYEFRRFDCFFKFEQRFPDDFLCISLRVPQNTEGILDFAAVFESLKRLNEPKKKLDNLTKSKKISPAVYSVLSGTSIIATVLHLSTNVEIPIRCCIGTQEEFDRAEATLDTGLSIVADATALVTMFMLGVHEKLAKVPYKLMVSEATMDLFRQIARNSSEIEPEWFEYVVSGRKQVTSDRQLSQVDLKEYAKSFYSWLEQNFEVRSGLGKATIPGENRKEWTQLLGDVSVECIGLAAVEQATLWTDDIAVAEVSLEAAIKDRVWTDTIMEHLLKQNLLDAEDLNRAKLSLIDHGYSFIRLTSPAIKSALEECRWVPSERPLKGVIDWLNRSGVQLMGALQQAMYILRESWSQTRLAHQPRAMTKAVIRALAARVDGNEVLRLLHRSLRFVFDSDPIAVDFCSSEIRQQLSLSGPDRLIILPGDIGWPK